MKHSSEPPSDKRKKQDSQRSIQQKACRKQAEQTAHRGRERKPLSPLWVLLVIGLFSVPWVIRHRQGITAQQQRAQTNERSDAFFAQINEYPKNESATQFDRLSAALGFSPNDGLSLNSQPVVQVNSDALKRYKEIEPLLNLFLQEKLGNTVDPIPALPSELKAYLASVQPELATLQAHLLQQAAPHWEINIARMSGETYPFPGLTNVFGTQKLLLLSAIHHSKQNQPSEKIAALEASWRLNHAIAQRPDLVSKLSVSTVSDYQAKLLRHSPDLSQSYIEKWQQRLTQQIAQQSVLKGIRFEAWLNYKTLQNSLSEITAQSGQLAAFSPVHRFTLSNIDTNQSTHRALDMLDSTSVCDLSQADMEARVATIQTAQWNETSVPKPKVLARRWKTAGDRALSLELTQQALAAYHHYQQYKQWPKPARAQSEQCPQAQWIREETDGNTITIRLDHKLSEPSSQQFTAILKAPLNP